MQCACKIGNNYFIIGSHTFTIIKGNLIKLLIRFGLGKIIVIKESCMQYHLNLNVYFLKSIHWGLKILLEFNTINTFSSSKRLNVSKSKYFCVT